MNCDIINPRALKRLMTTSSTATSFASKIPTITEPDASALAGAVKLFGEETLEMVFFGADGNNDTFNARVIGWNVARGAVGTALWLPTVLCNLSVTLGNIAGVTGAEVAATEFFSDTITISSGTAVVPSPQAGDTVARVIIPVTGYQYFEVIFDLAGAQEAVDMNALYMLY